MLDAISTQYVASGFSRTWCRRPVASGFSQTWLLSNHILNSVEDLLEHVHRGANERVILRTCDQSSPLWVLYDVARHDERGFVVSQNAFEPITLPETTSMLLLVVETRQLFGARDESLAISRFVGALDQEMNMTFFDLLPLDAAMTSGLTLFGVIIVGP